MVVIRTRRRKKTTAGSGQRQTRDRAKRVRSGFGRKRSSTNETRDERRTVRDEWPGDRVHTFDPLRYVFTTRKSISYSRVGREAACSRGCVIHAVRIPSSLLSFADRA